MRKWEGRRPPPPPPPMTPPPMMPPAAAAGDPVFFGHYSVMRPGYIPQQPPPYGAIYSQPPQQYFYHPHHLQIVPDLSHQTNPFYGLGPSQQRQPYAPYLHQQEHPYDAYHQLDPQIHNKYHNYQVDQPQPYDNHFSDEDQTMSQQSGSLRIGDGSLMEQSTSQAPIDPTTSQAPIDPTMSQNETQPTMASGQLPLRAPKYPPPLPPHLAGLPPPTCQEEVRTLKASGLPPWMKADDFAKTTRLMSGVSKIRIPVGDGMKSKQFAFIEFHTRALAEAALEAHKGKKIVGSEYDLILTWSAYVAPDFQLYCTGFPTNLSDDELYQPFRARYSSVKNAFIREKGRYGFVCFRDEAQRNRALREMAGYEGWSVQLPKKELEGKNKLGGSIRKPDN